MLLSVSVCVGTANPANILNDEKHIGDVLAKQRRSTKTSFHSFYLYIGWMEILLEKLLYLGSNCHLLVASPNAFYLGECLFCLDVHLHLNSFSNSFERYCLFQRPESWQSISPQRPGTDSGLCCLKSIASSHWPIAFAPMTGLYRFIIGG